MSGGGGKGGEQKQSIDPRLAAASAEALTRAGEAAKIPYSPNRGVTIAAFTPQQEAAMRNTASAAEAFGMEGGGPASMPTAETSATGIRGYSTGAEYDDMIGKSLSPALQEAINSFFIDRNTGGPLSLASRSANAKKRGTNANDVMRGALGLGATGEGK